MDLLDNKGNGIVKDWNNNPVRSVTSKGGVIALVNPFQNLVSTGISPWPPSEIVQKLYCSRQIRAYSSKDADLITSHLGYYCDLQSIHSEDAITWSIFGTVSRSSNEVRSKWLNTLFEATNLPGINCNHTEITLWRRIPHPDNLASGGPEIDVLITTANAVVLVEAKWLSKTGLKQGKAQDKDQIQLRGEYLQTLGRKYYSGANFFAVLGIALNTTSIIDTTPYGALFRETTWSEVCGIVDHPLYEEIQNYYQWKRKHSKIKHLD